MKLTRVVLKDYEAWYDNNGTQFFQGPLPDAKQLLQALGHEIEEQVEPRHCVAYLGNAMPILLESLREYFKQHKKIK